MVGNGAVDVDEIDIRIGQYLPEIRVPRGNAEPISDLVQLAFRALADRRDLDVRMRLIDRNELCPEAKSNEFLRVPFS